MSVAVESVSELKNIRVDEANGVIRWLVAKNSWYYPDLNATEPNDDDSVIAPNLGVGRWKKQESLQTGSITDLIADFKTGTFTVEGARRHFLDGSFTSISIDIVLPSSPTNGFSCEVVPYNVVLNRIAIFRATGNVLVNNFQNDYTTTLQNGVSYKIYYANSTIGWIITASDINTRLNRITRGSSITVYTRQWNESAPYTYDQGIYDLVGKNFNVNNTYNPNLAPNVGFEDSGVAINTNYIEFSAYTTLARLQADGQPTVTKTILFSRIISYIRSFTYNWSSTAGNGITSSRVAGGELQSNPPLITINNGWQSPSNSSYLINPTGFLIILNTGANSSTSLNHSTWLSASILGTLSNFANAFQNVTLQGFQLDSVTNNSASKYQDLVQRSSQIDLLFANKNSRSSLTLFENGTIKVIPHTDLPAPYNTNKNIGIRYNILFNKGRYYDAFALSFNSLVRTGHSASLPTWFSVEIDNPTTVIVFFEMFGTVYQLT